MAVQVGKAVVFAVVAPREAAIDVSKAVAFAVTWTSNPGISLGKAMAYAVVIETSTTARPTQVIVT